MTGVPCPPWLRREMRTQLRQGNPPPPALTVPCTHCHAPAQQPCTGARGRRLTQAHASRYEAAGLAPRIDQPTHLEAS